MLASAYQPLHCNISNQLARELCQIRWKRRAHKERSIDLKAELLWASALLNNFTHYLLQQDFLFSSISKCCSSDSQGSWSNIRVFQLQYNIYLIHCCSCSAKPALQLSHSLLWKIFYQPMNSLDLLRNIKMLRQPFKEKSSATEKFLLKNIQCVCCSVWWECTAWPVLQHGVISLTTTEVKLLDAVCANLKHQGVTPISSSPSGKESLAMLPWFSRCHRILTEQNYFYTTKFLFS